MDVAADGSHVAEEGTSHQPRRSRQTGEPPRYLLVGCQVGEANPGAHAKHLAFHRELAKPFDPAQTHQQRRSFQAVFEIRQQIGPAGENASPRVCKRRPPPPGWSSER